MATDQRAKAKSMMASCGYKDGGAVKPQKLAAGGAAKVRKGVATPAGAPKPATSKSKGC